MVPNKIGTSESGPVFEFMLQLPFRKLLGRNWSYTQGVAASAEAPGLGEGKSIWNLWKCLCSLLASLPTNQYILRGLSLCSFSLVGAHLTVSLTFR